MDHTTMLFEYWKIILNLFSIKAKIRILFSLLPALCVPTVKVPQDEVKDAWLKEIGVEHLKEVAEHYGIFKHLFGNAFFYPVQHVRIAYDYDEEYVTPVYMGNRVTPKDVSCISNVCD